MSFFNNDDESFSPSLEIPVVIARILCEPKVLSGSLLVSTSDISLFFIQENINERILLTGNYFFWELCGASMLIYKQNPVKKEYLYLYADHTFDMQGFNSLLKIFKKSKVKYELLNSGHAVERHLSQSGFKLGLNIPFLTTLPDSNRNFDNEITESSSPPHKRICLERLPPKVHFLIEETITVDEEECEIFTYETTSSSSSIIPTLVTRSSELFYPENMIIKSPEQFYMSLACNQPHLTNDCDKEKLSSFSSPEILSNQNHKIINFDHHFQSACQTIKPPPEIQPAIESQRLRPLVLVSITSALLRKAPLLRHVLPQQAAAATSSSSLPNAMRLTTLASLPMMTTTTTSSPILTTSPYATINTCSSLNSSPSLTPVTPPNSQQQYQSSPQPLQQQPSSTTTTTTTATTTTPQKDKNVFKSFYQSFNMNSIKKEPICDPVSVSLNNSIVVIDSDDESQPQAPLDVTIDSEDDDFTVIVREEPFVRHITNPPHKLPTKSELEQNLPHSKALKKYIKSENLSRDANGLRCLVVYLCATGTLSFEVNGCRLTFENSTIPEPRIWGRQIDSYDYKPTTSRSKRIDNFSLLSLNPGAYVNDMVIDFYLHYLHQVVMPEHLRESAHFFGNFFYNKLDDKLSKEARHSLVAGWTRRIDIFSKDFLFMPINQHSHWFLCIVCFPWLAGTVDYEKRYINQSGFADTSLDLYNTGVKHSFTQIRKQRLDKLKREGISPMPCILIFDSLSNSAQRKCNVGVIREHLQVEWDTRFSHIHGPMKFTRETIRGFCPKVTKQTNGYDCGVYCLSYAEYFIRNPPKQFSRREFEDRSFSLAKIDGQTLRADIQELILQEYRKSKHMT